MAKYPGSLQAITDLDTFGLMMRGNLLDLIYSEDARLVSWMMIGARVDSLLKSLIEQGLSRGTLLSNSPVLQRGWTCPDPIDGLIRSICCGESDFSFS